jgi:hypothetical protein
VRVLFAFRVRFCSDTRVTAASGFGFASDEEGVCGAKKIEQAGDVQKTRSQIANDASRVCASGFENGRKEIKRSGTDFREMVQHAKNIFAVHGINAAAHFVSGNGHANHADKNNRGAPSAAKQQMSETGQKPRGDSGEPRSR